MASGGGRRAGDAQGLGFKCVRGVGVGEGLGDTGDGVHHAPGRKAAAFDEVRHFSCQGRLRGVVEVGFHVAFMHAAWRSQRSWVLVLGTRGLQAQAGARRGKPGPG